MPLYLAEMDDDALVSVAHMAEKLLGFVTEVQGRRWVARAWEEAGGQQSVNYSGGTVHDEVEQVWNRQEPQWPGDETGPAIPLPPVDADSTQVIPGAEIAALGDGTQFVPVTELVELVARDAVPGRKQRPDPVVLADPIELIDLPPIPAPGEDWTAADRATDDTDPGDQQ